LYQEKSLSMNNFLIAKNFTGQENSFGQNNCFGLRKMCFESGKMFWVARKKCLVMKTILAENILSIGKEFVGHEIIVSTENLLSTQSFC
jgi:hypothetical protein